MRKLLFLFTLFACSGGLAQAQPTRIVLLDFEDLTGAKPDALLGGAVAPGALAAKGVNLLGKQLLNQEGFVLIDRRDFVEQVEKLQPRDAGENTPTKPTFIHAAQALRADVILRGSLLSFSTGKDVINQGGYQTENSTVSLRVSLEALDALDGTVIAMADGVARDKFRQTAEVQTVLGEEDVLTLMEGAIAEAAAQVEKEIQKKRADQAARPTIKLNVKTSADPALVEIDGILIGASPLVGHTLYKGDHVLTVGKAGYYDVTKRILFENDTAIEVPLFRFELTAEEEKEILEKARLHVFNGEPGLVIHNLQEVSE